MSIKNNIQTICDLSPMQSGILLHVELRPNDTFYFNQISLRLFGHIDIELVKISLQKVIDRHDTLRTKIVYKNIKTPRQVVLKNRALDFVYVNLEDENNTIKLSKKEVEITISNYKLQDKSRKFDLSNDPLFRIAIIKIAANEFEFIWSFHHIIMDGWSSGVVFSEFRSIYLNSLHNVDIKLKKPRQYLEYLKWLDVLDHEKMKNYWENYLKGFENPSVLPKLIQRENEIEYVNRIENYILDEVKTKALKTLTKENNITFNTLIQSVWTILLAKYNNTEDILFGNVVSGRPSMIEGIENMVGLFINTIPVRACLRWDMNVLELFKLLQEKSNESLNYSYFPLVEIRGINELKSNLFDHIIVFENYPLDLKIEKNDIEIDNDFYLRKIEVVEQSEYDLNIVVELRDNLNIKFIYNEKVYSRSQIRDIIVHIENIFNCIIPLPDIKISDIDILNEREKNQLLYDFNNTLSDYPRSKTIIELFEEQVDIYPDNIALVYQDQKLTYKELNGVVNYFAQLLIDQNIRDNHIVAILSSRSINMIVSILSIIKIGAAYLPIDPTFPKVRVNEILTEADVNLILLGNDYINDFDYKCNRIIIDDIHFQGKNNFIGISSCIDSNRTAYIMFTSGTTGKSNGILISHSNITKVVKNVNYIDIRPSDKLLQLSNFAFDGSVFDIFGALLNGSQLILIPNEDAIDIERVGEIIMRESVSITFITTALFNVLVDYCLEKLTNIKKILFGGQKASLNHVEKAFKYLGKDKLVNVYGPTESTVFATYYEVNDIDLELNTVPIGKPISNTKVYILDRYQKIQPIGISGELYISGEGLAKEYLKNEKLTNEKFIEHPYIKGERIYKTGDIVRWLPNGNIEFLGRVDNQVKIRGFRIELEEIEKQLSKHDLIKEVVVLVKENEGNKYLVAYYLAQNQIEITELRNFLSSNLPAFMIPSCYVRMEKFPLTSNGKIACGLLPEPEDIIEIDYIAPNGDDEDVILKIWSEVLGFNTISTNRNFFEIGGNSLMLMKVKNKLQMVFNREIQITDLFKYPTIKSLAIYLGSGNVLKDEPINITEIEKSIQNEVSHLASDIAVIGMSGRFPGANNLNEFWENLRSGKESITRKENLNIENSIVYAKGYLDDYESFDADFFNYTPSEALLMDPQIRIFHECVWEGLEDAGYSPNATEVKIGLYGGASLNPYFNINISENKNNWIENWESLTYGDKDFLCPRVSYKLNLKGPSVTIATACSTSLVAVDTACKDLFVGRCEIAVVGGVSISLHDNDGYLYQKGMILSPDGRCRAFDKNSAGTVGGNGVGVVVLKKLDKAIVDGDYIHAIIKGSATNNDGNQKVGFTAPSIQGQSRVIEMAIESARVEADSISFVEAHGTGTALGDPIEIEGLKKAFNSSKKYFCAVGSVKTNIGHLDSAAGVAGLIKTVLSLKNKQIPPTLHFEEPNPNLNIENSPFYINQDLKEWENVTLPRRAGVSSFGIGGTNAHVILEEAPEFTPVQDSRSFHLVLLSAKTHTALDNNVQKLVNYLKFSNDSNFSDIAYTLLIGREHFVNRRMIVCSNRIEAIDLLTKNNSKESNNIQNEQKQVIVFMFSGQGSQYVNMYRDLYLNEVFFKEKVDECFTILKQKTGKSIEHIIFPDEHASPTSKLDATEFTQPSLFIMEYALAKLLIKWGVFPTIMIGHSIGEYVAACLSGVFSLEDALDLVAKRGELMQKTSRGAMLSISISHEKLLPFLKDSSISLAAVNSSDFCVVSGSEESINSFKKLVEEQGYQSKVIKTSHAFHSYLMDEILSKYAEVIADVKVHPQQIPFISNFTGNIALDSEISSPQYWVNHLRHEVRFSKGIEAILRNENAIFIELGPGNSLSTFVRSNKDRTSKHRVINLIRHPNQSISDVKHLLNGLGELWLYGVKINWNSFYEGEKRRKISLPTYSFDKIKFPILTKGNQGVGGGAQETLLARQSDLLKWFYSPAWKTSLISLDDTIQGKASSYVIFADNIGVSKVIVNGFKQGNVNYILVVKGEMFCIKSKNKFELNPKNEEDFKTLFKHLYVKGVEISSIIYAWSISEKIENGCIYLDSSNFYDANFFGLINIAKSLNEVSYSSLIHINVLTNNLHNVLGNENISIESSPIIGLIKVISQEYPMLSTSNIDISLSETKRKYFFKILNNELKLNNNGRIVALRNSRKWELIYERINFTPDLNSKSFKQNGVYLITGGLGELGFTLSKYLLGTYNANIVLLGRSVLPPQKEWSNYLSNSNQNSDLYKKIYRISSLNKEKGTLTYLNCDLSSDKELTRVVKFVESKFGKINGLIHAAGVTNGKTFDFISELDEGDYIEQYKSKLNVLQILYNVFSDKQLDFCFVTSSISTILGGIKFGAYASANICMDYYINFLKGKNNLENWLIINFDGIVFDDTQSHGIRTNELQKVFEYAFVLKYFPQIIVSVADINQRLEEWIFSKKNLDASSDSNLGNVLLSEFESNQSVSIIETNLISLWKDFFGIQNISINDDFFELGGDSLKAIKMIGRIYKKFNIELSVTELFNNSTIKQLVNYFVNYYEKNKIKTLDAKDLRTILSIEKKDFYPLTSVQKRLYFLYELDPLSIAYNMPLILKVFGDLDRLKLTSIFRELIQRHESLRTFFEFVGDEPCQKIIDKFDFEIEYYNSHGNDEQIIKEFIRPFNLKNAPLIRVGLVNISMQENILMVDMHHIVTDGVSKNILIKDFISLYNGLKLNDLFLQYKDYALWTRNEKNKILKSKQRLFWVEEFLGEINKLNLPTDYPRPFDVSHGGGVERFTLDKKLSAGLKVLSTSEGTTIFMVLLSIYGILLSKLSNQEDLVVGTPVVGRQNSDVEGIIGMFVNTLAIRVKPQGNQRYQDYLSLMSARVLASFDHQNYPYEELVEALNVPRDMGRNPLFDVMFSFQNFEEYDLRVSGLTLNSYKTSHIVSKFDLELMAFEFDDQIHLAFEYSSSLFKRSTIERFIEYFRKIASTVVFSSSTILADIEIISEAERKQLIEAFNSNQLDYARDKTVINLFEEQVERTPLNVALSFWEGTMTYSELKDRSDRVSSYLKEVYGVATGDLVGIMLEREEYLIPIIFGILKTGAAYVPIDLNYPAERVNSILVDSSLKVIVARGNHFDSLSKSSNIHVIELNERIASINAQKILPLDCSGLNSSSLAYVIYTSGSTGSPKGVMVEHGSLYNLVQHMQERYPLNEGDTYLFKTTYCFDVSVAEIFGWFLSGGKLSLLPVGAEIDPREILSAIERDRVTHVNFVPSMFSAFIDILDTDNVNRVKCLKYIFLAGEVLPHEHVRRFQLLGTGVSLENMYGPTEGTIYSSGYSTKRDEDIVIPIGKPLSNVPLYILNRYKGVQPIGVSGELCIGGMALARGYLNRVELTNERFICNPFVRGERIYQTGDVARWLPNGNIEYVGRMDGQVKIRGYRIELGELESQILSNSKVKEAVVIVWDNGDEKQLVAYYVGAVNLEPLEVREYLLGRLPAYMVPAYCVRLDRLPLTRSGKIDRRELPVPEVQIGMDYIAPRGELEEQLVEIWSDVLRVEQVLVSVTRSFFDMGGHSLKATVLVNKIAKRLGVEIPLRIIFKINTIKGIAEYIENEKWIKKSTSNEVKVVGEEFTIE